jgi:hypothetical protein
MLNYVRSISPVSSTSPLPFRSRLLSRACVSERSEKPSPYRPGGGFFDRRDKGTGMLAHNTRPERKLIYAFTLTILGAFGAGLPMALAIILDCS